MSEVLLEILHVFSMPHAWVALIMLMFLEIVLGVDNIVFISIMSSKLPEQQQSRARKTGLMLAMITRIALLFCISLLMRLTKPLFDFDFGWLSGSVTGQSIIIFVGGLFLLYKSVSEIHHKVSNEEEEHGGRGKKSGFWGVIVQILALDIVFSLDSVLTAIGLVSFNEFGYVGAMTIIILAIVASVVVMMVFADPVSKLVNGYPTIQILGLSFLLLIAVMLIIDAAHLSNMSVFGATVGEIPRGYIYFAIAFSLVVEILNLRMQRRRKKRK